MPKIVRTRYGGVWPSSPAESDGTIYATDGVDADVSDASLRPMRAPRQVSESTGKSMFLDGCVLLLNDLRVYYAHNSVGGNAVYRTGANGYPEVAYSFDSSAPLIAAPPVSGVMPSSAPPPPPAPPAPAPASQFFTSGLYPILIRDAIGIASVQVTGIVKPATKGVDAFAISALSATGSLVATIRYVNVAPKDAFAVSALSATGSLVTTIRYVNVAPKDAFAVSALGVTGSLVTTIRYVNVTPKDAFAISAINVTGTLA